jgi:hypothetical protein
VIVKRSGVEPYRRVIGGGVGGRFVDIYLSFDRILDSFQTNVSCVAESSTGTLHALYCA